jgi:tRNA A-37 threonylcarbamoyl transferase component Bud32
MTRPLTAPGRLVCGRYRLHQQIGGGGMGAVWLARDELLGRQVAIKQVLPPSGTDPAAIDQQRERALREGRIAARLSHPHAIAVYDVAVDNGLPWLVMEYLPSRSLAAVLTEDGVLRVDQVAQIGAQVADALAATHAAGIVHRDVKPANVLIGRGGRFEGLVKITDFGISHASGDVTLTQTGQITGTPAFLAPEVAQGEEMTEASDVFSLGATLYTCLEGSPPFGMDENPLGMLHKVAGGVIRPPLRSGSLMRPLLRMLAADPAERPSMADVRDELVKLAAGRDGDTTTVLTRRADLRPAPPGRTRTATFAANVAAPISAPPVTPPVPVAAATPPPAPPPPAAPAPAAPAREEPHHETRPETSGRRPPLLWVVIGLVTALLAGLVVFWVAAVGGSPSTSAHRGGGGSAAATSQPGSGAPETGGAPAQAGQQTSQPPASSSASSSASAGPSNPLTAANITDFLTSYHQQVKSDPAAAWARTGPTLRAAIGSEQAYADFWNQFSDVRLSDVQASDGNNVATGTLALIYPNGTSDTGRHVFTFIVRNGQLVLDSDTR